MIEAQVNIVEALDDYARENNTTYEELTDSQFYEALSANSPFNREIARKPKSNRKSGVLDNCYTPPHAVLPLLSYIQAGDVVWESAPGDLFMVNALKEYVSNVVYSDQDFFKWQPEQWNIQITNCPYSRKYEWLKRSYELDKPFALLLPVESIGAKKGNTLIAEYGAQLILLTKRINFHMPFKGYDGNGAQFPVLWWTYKMNLPKDIMVWDVDKEEYL